MKKEYVKPTLRKVDVDSFEVLCGSVYLDDKKSADLWIYDEDGDEEVNIDDDSGWVLW